MEHIKVGRHINFELKTVKRDNLTFSRIISFNFFEIDTLTPKFINDIRYIVLYDTDYEQINLIIKLSSIINKPIKIQKDDKHFNEITSLLKTNAIKFKTLYF